MLWVWDVPGLRCLDLGLSRLELLWIWATADLGHSGFKLLLIWTVLPSGLAVAMEELLSKPWFCPGLAGEGQVDAVSSAQRKLWGFCNGLEIKSDT